MMELSQTKPKSTPPFKSVAGALLLTVILGPVGLLYSSIRGGVVMIFLGFIVMCTKLLVPIILVWLISCIWSAASAEKYNQKILGMWAK